MRNPKAVRIAGQAIVHATLKIGHFRFYTYTACMTRTVRRVAINEDTLVGEVDEPVDCMTCLVAISRSQGVW